MAQVSEYRNITVDDYQRDWKSQRIIERTLQMAIEACVDVATHVIADRGLQATMVRMPKPRTPERGRSVSYSAWISASAFSSQNRMSISRCIVVAALLLGRLDEARRLAVVGTV